MKIIAGSPAFAPAIAGAGSVVIAFLIPHIVAGLTALASGAVVIVSRTGTGWHVRAGTTYFWALAVLAATAAGLTAVRGARDLPVSGLGLSPWHLPPRDGTPGGSLPPGCGGPGLGTAPHSGHDQLLHRDVDRVPG